MKRFNDYSLRFQWTVLGVGGVALTLAAILAAGLWGISGMNNQAVASVEELAAGDLDHIAQGVVRLIEAQDEALRHEVDGLMRVAQRRLDDSGGVQLFSRQTNWAAQDQFTKSVTDIRLPTLGLRQSSQDLDTFVQDLGTLTGAALTVFQRMNEDGDMLRVATTVQTAEGKPAIGTYIPATMADGSANGVLASVLKGTAYSGVAFVVDAWYVSAYNPLTNAAGEVVGMLFIGIPRDRATTLREALYDTVVGETGYVYVLGSAGAEKGSYIISRLGERDGENIWETLDADGKPIIQDIIAAGVALEPGELGTVRYRWQNPGETEPRWKITRVAYYAPYNWVIGVGAYEDEYMAVEQHLANQLQQTLLILGAIGLTLMAGAFIGMRFVAGAVAGPLTRMVATANGLAVGDLNQEIIHRSGDEIGQLADAFRTMIAHNRKMAEHAARIAAGDLSQDFAPASEQDTLGQAFKTMTNSLKGLITTVRRQALSITTASGGLASAAEESGHATNQIATTMQQLATGATQQADGVARTANTIEEVRRAIEGVAQGSQVQASAISQTSTAMTHLSRTVAEVGAGAREQSNGLRRAAAAREDLVGALGQMRGAADGVGHETVAAAEAAHGGGAIVAETIAGMQRVRTATEQLSERVRDLGRHSAQIGSIVETIDDIAAQTNLLALNAAIEAARAGEHGKGFAVVAEEVRKLAEKSATATKEISAMVQTVQTGSTEAVEAMRQAGDDVAEAVRLTDQAGSAFQHITTGAQSAVARVDSIRAALEAMQAAASQLEQVVNEVTVIADRNRVSSETMNRLSAEVVESVENVSAVIEQNTAATEQMAASVTEVADSIQTSASISEENSASVEEVSASTEEISAQSEEVAASAQALSDMAEGLRAAVAQFQTGDEEQAQQPTAVREQTKRVATRKAPVQASARYR